MGGNLFPVGKGYGRALFRGLDIRGGGEETDDEYDDEYDSDADLDEEESDSDEEEEEESDSEGGESDREGDEEEDEEESSASASPAKITLKTALTNHVLIDQSIEITASPTRNVLSLKQSVSRQFKSRPPMDAIVLRLDGQILDDDVLVQDLVDENDEEDEDDEHDDDDGLPKMTIIVDMVPPVDPKFGTEMKNRLDDMTNQQVLDAYIANLASLHQNSIDMMHQPKGKEDDVDGEDSDEEEDEDDESVSPPITQTNLEMQRHIMLLQEQIAESLSDDAKKSLEKKDTPSSPIEDDLDSYDGDLLLKESIKRKKRKGGATMNVKRALQKNLNINWPDTLRNFLLFLFFGYFGGRNAMSRTIMLLGAPACFIIQARPVKVAIKQLVYTIGKPPGILLSLLPAPRQAIMSCDYDMALKSLYGDDISQYNDVIDGSMDKLNDDSEEGGMSDVYDSENDEYDDEY